MSPQELKELKEKLESFVMSHEGGPSNLNNNNNNNNIVKTIPARANKNRPREVSSKKPERRQVKKIIRRDPRFEESSGSLDMKEFKEEYKFLDEVHEKEKKVLSRQIRREKNESTRQELLKLQQRLRNQDDAKKERDEEKKLKEALVKEQLAKTGNPYINDSKVKAAKLVNKFKELQKTGKLDKYLERKRKKNASKERHKLV